MLHTEPLRKKNCMCRPIETSNYFMCKIHHETDDGFKMYADALSEKSKLVHTRGLIEVFRKEKELFFNLTEKTNKFNKSHEPFIDKLD